MKKWREKRRNSKKNIQQLNKTLNSLLTLVEHGQWETLAASTNVSITGFHT